ncbi:uncharacterized protein LOC133716435 [Rosa rugosa]|uniref:uncharacterized protein LOC133716435 n=1 Tax=Rosa rugosa TaxID=74645 RepID=UPI002B415EF4|nr:uncharacterized protein LOC133716435 [Rosa rugosa]
MLKLSEDITTGRFNILSTAAGSSGTVSPCAFVPEVLNRFNYEDWSLRVETYLLAEDLWDVVEASNEPTNDEREYMIWRKKNAKALLAIQISCGSDTFSLIRNTRTAKVAWDALAAKFKPPPVNLPEYESNTEDFSVYVPFFDAVRSGDWSTATEFLSNNPSALTARSPYSGKTALHIAVDTCDVQIVEAVVQLMQPEDLEIKANDGKTALAFVADVGITKMAKCLVIKNNNVVAIGDAYNMLPVVSASSNGHWDLANYLYSVTPAEALLWERNAVTLVCQCIHNRKFDIASNLLNHHPKLAVAIDHFGESPLKAWSSVSFAFQSRSLIEYWISRVITIQPHELNTHAHVGLVPDHQQSVHLFQRLVRCLLVLTGPKMIYEEKLIHARSLDFLYHTAKVIKDLDAKQMQDGLVYEAIFHAVEEGNVDFITAICTVNPELIWSTDEEKRTLLHLAIKYRQRKVYDLIHGFYKRHALANLVDKYNNSLLHVAAMMSPFKQLNYLPGAALQLQRELQWFKEVESIVPRKAFESKIFTDHMTPRELFTKNHKELMKEGEKWMKDTANSCTVLGALVITIVFAAAITVPGGNNQNTGLPMFLDKKLFSVFIISDALSFFFSTTSLLTFWGIVTSRYAEDDFLKNLPAKMAMGLASLLCSIMTMMIAFCSAILIMLNVSEAKIKQEGKSWISISIMVLAFIPETVSVTMLFPLFVQMYTSTYGRGIFARQVKFLH